MNVREMMRLQGMNPEEFTLEVTERQLAQQLGNAMSLNVLERIMFRLLPAAGLRVKEDEDRWESGKATRELEKSRNGSFRSTNQGITDTGDKITFKNE